MVNPYHPPRDNAFFDTGTVGIGSPTDVADDPLLDAEHHPTAASPLVDAGVDVGLPFAGATPDIGWFELGGEACAEANAGGEGGAGSGGNGGGAAGGASGGNGASVGAQGQPDGGVAEGGCGCRIGANRATPWWLLALALCWMRRRR
jgi:hypothetical protein